MYSSAGKPAVVVDPHQVRMVELREDLEFPAKHLSLHAFTGFGLQDL
jgi:hypothetical protein